MEFLRNDNGELDLRAALDKCRVTVTGGAHRGASVINSSGAITIGKAESGDIVLFGDDVEPVHFRIKVEPGLFSKLVVHAMEGPVEIKGRTIVEVGEYTQIPAGAEIIAGTAALKVERVADPSNLAVPALRAGIVVLAFSTAWVGWSLITTIISIVPGSASAIVESVSAPVSRQIGAALGTPAAKEAASTEAYAWQARAKIEDLGLNRGLRVMAGPPEMLRVTGTINEAQAPSWNEFLRWYDSNPGFPKLVRDVARSEADTDLPALQSVWLEGEPTVYFKSGVSGKVGDVVPGEWRITAITAASVTVERDGSSVALTF